MITQIPYKPEIIKEKQDDALRFLCIGILVTLMGIFTDAILFTSIGGITSFVSGLSFLSHLKREKSASLELNKKGLVDHIEWVNYGLIEWCDITGIRVDNRFENMILIDVKNEEKYLKQLKVSKRYGGTYKMQLKHNDFGYGTAVFIKVQNLDEAPDIILATITSHWKQFRIETDNN
ncbi:STM3941 family protein [Limibacter armeniacum]|uniref:STM3941 family protein n=1 Tax=Limibacter armeniacum TaxID=466084 RepID=UPI002FE5FD9B